MPGTAILRFLAGTASGTEHGIETTYNSRAIFPGRNAYLVVCEVLHAGCLSATVGRMEGNATADAWCPTAEDAEDAESPTRATAPRPSRSDPPTWQTGPN